MSGSLFHYPRLRAVNSAGLPVPAARLYVYQAGTNVLAQTFTSASLTVAHANPQIANAAGEWAAIYLDPDAGYDYRFVCQTPTGAQLWAEDNVPASAATGGGTGGGGTGTPGDPGLSVAEVKIYQRASSPPSTPTGGSFNFATQSLSAPDGWSATSPAGAEPLYVSTAVAAVEGSTGTDSLLEWSAPVVMAQDGSSVDIVFKRAAAQPSTPAPSPSTPAGWYTDVASVPASSDKLWSSVGTRDNASQNWVWQLPIQVEGDQGPAGADASWYYIKPTAGTAIKNGTGTLTVEARRVFAGNDTLLNSGAIQLYVGSTLVSAANGYVAGSNGYTGIFDSGDIAGSVNVTLRNGPSGQIYDTLTLVDIADGTADTGKNAVYGYVEASNGLAFTRGSDQTTWSPSGATTRLDCTFVQGGADVARVAWLITRSSAGILTGATTTHGAGDLNAGRVTVTEINENSQAMTVKFAYSNAGDVAAVAETVMTSMAGSKGDPGDAGTPGVDGDAGLSIAELAIYKRASAAPSTPTGGSYNFTTLTLTAPAGWSSEIPTGYEPVYASRTVASVVGQTGTDSSLTWSAPVRALEDGASIDIIFKRNASQPATPADSAGVPAGWYSNVADAVGSDPLWSSVGSRAHAGENWVWQTPVRVEGEQGPAGADGADAELYYIRAVNGTAIKNSSGTVLQLEAHKVVGGTDTKLSTGTVKLYVGTTEVTVANGYATGSDGYNGYFDAGDIAGSVTVTLKDGSGGTPLDTITLVDVADGAADSGKNAVFGYVETDGPLAWVRAADQSTWTPSDNTLQFDCTFVQNGADVARVAHVITRASDGTLTGAAGTHTAGDLNGSRVTVTELGEGTQVLTIKFAYSYSGDETAVSETAFTSLSGANGTGTPGTPATSMTLSKLAIPLFAYQNGLVPSYATANGQATMWSGATDVTASTTFSIAASSNVTNPTINNAPNTPVAGSKGYYKIDALNSDTGSITIRGVYAGQTIDQIVTFSKSYAGYEIVGSLPITNLFAGRVVYLTTDAKLYRYNGSSWTRAVDGADITANSILANSIGAGQITAAKISVTDLSSISANLGTITAGVLQSSSGNVRHDLNNARVLFNSAPGQTGGMVRVQGAGFGPAGDFLDWYGPKPAGQTTDSGIVANLTDAAAYYYLKTNGASKSVTQRIRGEFEPKAWAKFNGATAPTTGSTANVPMTLLDSYNVSSVVRNVANQAGRYTVTFAEPLANANYAVVITGSVLDADSNPLVSAAHTHATTGFQIVTKNNSNNWTDGARISLVVFGSNVPSGSNVTQPSGGTGGGTIGWGNLPSNYVLP